MCISSCNRSAGRMPSFCRLSSSQVSLATFFSDIRQDLSNLARRSHRMLGSCDGPSAQEGELAHAMVSCCVAWYVADRDAGFGAVAEFHTSEFMARSPQRADSDTRDVFRAITPSQQDPDFAVRQKGRNPADPRHNRMEARSGLGFPMYVRRRALTWINGDSGPRWPRTTGSIKPLSGSSPVVVARPTTARLISRGAVTKKKASMPGCRPAGGTPALFCAARIG